MDFQEEKGFFERIWEGIENFNEGYDNIQEFSATMLMVVIALFMGFGMPILLGFIIYVDHERVMHSIASFMDEQVVWIGAAWVMFALALIPIVAVFDDLRNNRLSFENKEEKGYGGVTLVVVVRALRYFLGLWGELSFRFKGQTRVVWDDLGVEKKVIKKSSWLKKLEYFLIVMTVFLVFTDSLLNIEDVELVLEGVVWYRGLWNIFTQTEYSLFMPAVQTTLYTLGATLALTTVAREIALNVAEKLYERKQNDIARKMKAIKAIEQEKEKAVLTVLKSSQKDNRQNGFWTNLQKIEGILIEEDKVNTDEESLNFWDSQSESWISETPFKTKTALKNAIVKRIGVRNA